MFFSYILGQGRLIVNRKEYTSYEMKSQKHHHRVQHIREVCAKGNLFKNSILKERKGLHNSLYVPEYDFSYCAPQKTGSTSFKQAVYLLQHGIDDSIYNMARYKVHGVIKQQNDTKHYIEGPATRTVLIARNPYTRLYSGYIDKVYLSSYQNLACVISSWKHPEKICSYDATFQDFLDYQIHQATRGKKLDMHFRPIFLVKCNPCEMKIHTLIKQESLSDDIDYFLTHLGIDKSLHDFIIDGLTKRRADTTIPGVVKVIMNEIPRDIDPLERALRIWSSFQIQGLLSDNVLFPKAMFTNQDLSNETKIIDVLIATQKSNPLSITETKLQRQRYLGDAYTNISEKTIQGILKIYNADFELFEYSRDPPGRSFNKM